MAVFAYLAQDINGQKVEGQVEASEENEAIAKIQRQGFLVLRVYHADTQPSQAPAFSTPGAGVAKGKSASFFRRGGVSGADIIFTAEQLALLIKGGVPLLQGLKLLSENVASPPLRRALHSVSQDVANGVALSAALKRHPHIFSDIWVAMVEAGEAAGQLPKVLEELSSYLNQRDIIRAKIITAFLYPLIMITMSICVLIFFMVKIVPVFSDIFASFNLRLPTITLIVIGTSKFVTSNLVLILTAFAFSLTALKFYFQTGPGQWMKAKLLLQLPIFRGFINNMLLERFLANFALLLKCDVDVIRSLTILEKLFSGNRLFARTMAVTREKIKSGGTIAQGMAQTDIFPPLAYQVARVGEESGKLPQMLETLSLYYKRQMETFISRLTTVIDPIMVLGVGVIVTIIVLAVFMPIFELTQIGTHAGG